MSNFFDPIQGNERIKAYLTRMVEIKRISNSMLFAGPEESGKDVFAEAFAKMLICWDDPQGIHRRKLEAGNHPDIRSYRPEGKIGMHSIDSMRQFSAEVYVAPYEAQWKVFIIHDADRMLPYSANALLKTFEEPLKHSVIILVSSNPQAILSTVRSRCLKIVFKDESGVLKSSATGSAHEIVLKLLARGKLSLYKELTEIVAEIVQHVDQIKVQIEEEIRESVSGLDMTALQKQALEKEIEGAVSMKTAAEAHGLFDTILGWYRDLHLLSLNGNRSYLCHPEYIATAEQAVQRGQIRSIESVSKAVASARLALERSTGLNICLENLFLQLEML